MHFSASRLTSAYSCLPNRLSFAMQHTGDAARYPYLMTPVDSPKGSDHQGRVACLSSQCHF